MTSSQYVNTDVCYAIRYNVTVAVHIAEWACANPLCEQFDCYSGYLSGISFMNRLTHHGCWLNKMLHIWAAGGFTHISIGMVCIRFVLYFSLKVCSNVFVHLRFCSFYFSVTWGLKSWQQAYSTYTCMLYFRREIRDTCEMNKQVPSVIYGCFPVFLDHFHMIIDVNAHIWAKS